MKLTSPIIIVDLELNAQENPHIVWEDQIIEIGAVYVDKNLDLNTLQTFQVYIKHPQPLTPFITQLTGITQDMVDQGVSEDFAFAGFKKWIDTFHKHTKLLGWGSDAFDLSKRMFDKGQGPGLRCWNAKQIMEWETGKLEKTLKRSGLRSTMNAWGVEWDGKYGNQHSGLADSFNTLRLLKATDDLNKDLKNNMIDLLKKMGVHIKKN